MVDGKVHTFGVSGKLWRNGLVMYDHQTETLWSGVTGAALRGKLKGKQLEILAAQPKVRWDQWKATYPGSKVLTLYGFQDYEDDSYADYHMGPMTGIVPVVHRDDRLHPKAKVMAIRLGDQARAYPLELFNQETKLLTDRVADKDLVVYRDPVSEASAVFERELEGQALTFKAGKTWTTLEDTTTGSTWNIVTGKAVTGPLKGKMLARVPHYQIYWFGFVDFFPAATLFGHESQK